MEQGPKPGSASEAMSFGLMEYVDQLGLMMTSTKDSLTEQIGNLQELQRWTIASVQGVQQRADAAIQRLDAERQKLEAERIKLQGTQALLQTNTVQAIHDAVRRQSGDIKDQTQSALAEPLYDIKQAAGQVRQNAKDSTLLVVVSVFLLGMVGGLLLGYWPLRSSQNAMQEQLNRIEQSVTVQQQAIPSPVVPDPHLPTQKGKTR